MAGKKTKKKKKQKKPHSSGGGTGRIFVGVAGEGNSICAVKIRKTKTGAELLEAKQFSLANSLDSVEVAGDIFEDFEALENAEEGSVDISENDEELSLLGISTDEDEKKDDSGAFIDILKMAGDKGTKMAISLAEPQVFYNVFDSDWNLKGKKLDKKVVAELATMKEEYVSLKNDSYQLLNISGDRLMAIVRENELAVIHQMENVKSYTGNRLPFITFIESSEISLVNLVLQSYNLPEEAISLILHIGPETSHFIFLKGTGLHHISPSIATGYNSENVGETLSSRLLFELDSLDMQKVDNVFLSGYAAKTRIQTFLEDTFQDETSIQVLTVDKLDKGTFEDDLPPEAEEDPFASQPSDVPPASDMMPDYELDDPRFTDEIKIPDGEQTEVSNSKPAMSLADELEMELGGISAGSSIVDHDQELVNQEQVKPIIIEDPFDDDLNNIPYTDLPPMPEISDEGIDEIPQETETTEGHIPSEDLVSRVEEELANLPEVEDQPEYFQQLEAEEGETEIEETDIKKDDNSGSEETLDYNPNSDTPFIMRSESEVEEVESNDEEKVSEELAVEEETDETDDIKPDDTEETNDIGTSSEESEDKIQEAVPEDTDVEAEAEDQVIESEDKEDSEKEAENSQVEESESFSPVLEVPDEFSRADIELAIYAPAIGAAMRAAGITGDDFINLDICPTKIKEGQNRLMISTPGWIIMMLIPLIGAYTYMEVDKQSQVVSDLKWQLIPLREQIGQYESIETSITAAENTLANFERSFSVIDSLVIGTDTWSTFLNKVMNISDDLAGFWFTEIASMEGNKARLSGYSVYRNRIPRFVEKLGDAQLKRVDVQEIRKKKVYRFEVEAIVTKDEIEE